MTNEELIKIRIAKEKGYPNWEEMFNWIARNGELPVIVAQQIERVQDEFYSIAVNEWCDFNQEQRDEGGEEVTFWQYLKL